MSLNVRKALYSKLIGTEAVTKLLSSSTAVYHEQAPATAAFPYVIFAKSAGMKRRAFSAPEAFKRETWLIKAVDRNTTSNLAEGISEAIDATLDGGSLTVSGKTVADLYHVGDVDYLEDSGDQEYRHNGANYGVVLV